MRLDDITLANPPWTGQFMDPDEDLDRPLLAHADGLLKAAAESGEIDEPEGTVIVQISATLCRRIAWQMREADRVISSRDTGVFILGAGIGTVVGVAVMGMIGVMT